MFEVLLERSAEKDLRRLSAGVHDLVVDRIAALAKNPRPPGCRKLSGSESDWRIRVGEYRVIYGVADVIRVVRVQRIRHRREVYRKIMISSAALSPKARFEWSRWGASDIDWRPSASPQGRRLREQPSQFRWEDQFNLSLDPETAREFHDETLPQ